MDIAPDRLVLPAAQSGQASQLSEAPLPSLDEASPLPPRGTGGGGGPPVYHPFIQGLLDELPKPGSEWRVQDRAKWLQTSANIFDLIYNDLLDDADIIVKVSKDQLK